MATSSSFFPVWPSCLGVDWRLLGCYPSVVNLLEILEELRVIVVHHWEEVHSRILETLTNYGKAAYPT